STFTVAGLWIENGMRPRFAVKLGVEPLAVLNRVQKAIGDGHRNVEVGQTSLIILGMNESKDIRMRDRQDAHVGPTPHTALFDRLGHRVDDLHERNRTRRYAA